MTKTWKKTAEGVYAFLVDEQEAGSMRLQPATAASRAECRLGNEEFVIQRTGFWKTTLEITRPAGQVLASVRPEKWYAASWLVDYAGKQYTLRIRNNPLAEYVLLDADAEVAAYGLAVEPDALATRITTQPSVDYLLDFLLWYLFLPIATENLGDNLAFTTALHV